MSQLGGNDSKMVRYLVLIAVAVALAIGALVVSSIRDAGDKEAQLEERLSDKYGQEIEVRKDVEGGSRPSQVTIVTVDGTDRGDCDVTGPESDPVLDCAEVPQAHPGRVVAARDKHRQVEQTDESSCLRSKGPAVTMKSDFSEDEWSRIVRAPFVAGLSISLADPGGPIEAAKETMATIRSATSPPSREQLLTEVALDIQSEIQAKRHPLKGFKPSTGRAPGEEVLAEIREVRAIVAAKASAEETAAYGQWLVATAQAAADAAKEGGFLGFGAKQVSEGEQAMLEKVRAAVAQP